MTLPRTTDDLTVQEVAGRALTGRRERALLDEPSVLEMTRLLYENCRSPDPWIRAAVGTLDRFAREGATGSLPDLLAVGRADPQQAQASLVGLGHRHDGLTAGQLASLAFGPKLWWTTSGVPIAWRPLSEADSTMPMPGRRTHPDMRLLLLAVIGTGATEAELLGVRVRDAGRLSVDGSLVPDLEAEPLVVAYQGADDGARHLTFLSYEARAALRQRLAGRGALGPDDPLLLPAADVAAASGAAHTASRALIGAGNDVNVTMCRATGDFFRAWGMPGARFDVRQIPDPGPTPDS